MPDEGVGGLEICRLAPRRGDALQRVGDAQQGGKGLVWAVSVVVMALGPCFK
jgi:hypothetical protein